MPITQISDEAMAAGETYQEKRFGQRRADEAGHEQEEAPPKPKRVRKGRKAPVDPKIGMEISEDMARSCIAAGARNNLGGYKFSPAEPKQPKKKGKAAAEEYTGGSTAGPMNTSSESRLHGQQPQRAQTAAPKNVDMAGTDDPAPTLIFDPNHPSNFGFGSIPRSMYVAKAQDAHDRLVAMEAANGNPQPHKVDLLDRPQSLHQARNGLLEVPVSVPSQCSL